MEDTMITVMGATGHTGKKIAEALIEAGQKVRALDRSERKLAELERSGAEVLTGDVADAAFLTTAFRGADAVYTLLPTDRQSPDFPARQQQEGEAIVDAIRESGVRYLVALSSLGLLHTVTRLRGEVGAPCCRCFNRVQLRGGGKGRQGN